MSINPLETEVANVYNQITEAEARRKALEVELEPVIDSYFRNRIRNEQNPELRRDFAYLNSSKRFEVLNSTTLRFSGRSISGPITFDITVDELTNIN